MQTRTLVDELIFEVSGPIFRGEITPGTKLATVRQLAVEHDTTVPTIQRVITRLEELGLIAVRQGSGLRVLDPTLHASQSALPYWLEALRDVPQAAGVLFGDFLNMRAVLAADLLTQVARRNKEPIFAEFRDAVDAFEACVARRADLEQIVDTDLEVVRSLLRIHRQLAFSTVFNGLESLLRALPEVAQAIYAEPTTNIHGWRLALKLCEHGADFSALLPLVSAIDAAATQRFVTLLEDSCAQ